MPWLFFAVGIPVFILVLLTGFLILLYSIFANRSGWNALAQKYGVIAEPEGKKLTRQTIKVGAVRWRFCVTVIFSIQGLYLELAPQQPILLAIHKHPPVLIPWFEFRKPRKGWLYLGWKAIELSIGEPQVATITFPESVYKEMSPRIGLSPISEET